MGKTIFFAFLLVPGLAFAQFSDCNSTGPLLEKQITTTLTAGLLRSTGSCVRGAVVNGGLEMVGANLSIIDGDTVGQVLRWTGTDWETRLIIFPASTGGVDTVYNGLTDRDTAFVLGGPLVEHTRIHGQKAYDLTLDDMRTVLIEAQRTSGVAFSSLTMGSTAVAGIDFAHYNEADAQKQALAAVNYSTGNVLRVQNSTSNGTYLNQYDAGGGLFQTDIYASNGTDAKTIRINRDAIYLMYLEALDITHEAAFVMVDTFTGQLRYKSPADFAGLYGDDWGSQTVSSTARFSGVGTVGSPLELAQQGATSGQVLKWNGSAWTPGTDNNDVTAEPITQMVYGTGSGVDSDSKLVRIASRNDIAITGVDASININTAPPDTSGWINIRHGIEPTIKKGIMFYPYTRAEYDDLFPDHPSLIHLKYDPSALVNRDLSPFSGFSMESYWGKNDNLPSDTFGNMIHNIGFNLGNEKPNSTKLYTSWEQRYRFGGVGKSYSEWHLEYWDTLGRNIRPITSAMAWDGSTSIVGFCSDYTPIVRSYSEQVSSGEEKWAEFNYKTGLFDFYGKYKQRIRGRSSEAIIEKRSNFRDVYRNVAALDDSDVLFLGDSAGVKVKNRINITRENAAHVEITSPETRIHFDSVGVLINSRDDANYRILGMKTTGSATELSHNFDGVSYFWERVGYGNQPYTFSMAAPTNTINVSSAGNVGINQNSGYSTLTIAQRSNDLAGGILLIPTAGNYVGLFTNASNDFVVNRGGSDRLFLTNSGMFGIGTAPAQTLHVQGTARITGSDGTATAFMGRDADGDISAIGVGAGIALSGGNAQADIGSGLNFSGNDIAWGGTLTENTTVDFDTYDVFFTNMPTSTTEDEALVIDSGTGKLARGQIPYTALRNPGEATYLGANGGTGETVSWQPEDILVEADPTAGHLTVELNTSMKQGLAYSLFGCCNLTYNITISASTIKLSGSYGTTTTYTLGAGEHLEVIRMSTNTFYVSKK